MKITISLDISCECGEKYKFLGSVEYKPEEGFYKEIKEIKEEMEEFGWVIPSQPDGKLKCPECAGNIEVYCHECSVAGGADKPIYHALPVCK